MNSKAFSIPYPRNSDISIDVYPGHFTTNHFHLSHYLDLDNLKTNATLAKKVARELAFPYITKTFVDTIVCMEGTELIGAYLADELTKDELRIVNKGKDVYVVKPMNNVNRQLTFQSNLQKLITGQRVLLLVTTVSSGTTLRAAKEVLDYYGANLVGISTLFNTEPKDLDDKVNSLFTTDDIPGYAMYKTSDCDMCSAGRKLDAIVIQGGYTSL